MFFYRDQDMKYLTLLAVISFVFSHSVMANQGTADMNIKVVGIASGSDGNGIAIISINGQPEKNVSAGSSLAPGVTLYKVYSNKVAILKQGDVIIYPLTAGEPYIPPAPINSFQANGQSRVILGPPPEPESDLEERQDSTPALADYYMESGQSRRITESIPDQADNTQEDEMELAGSAELDIGQSRTFFAIPAAASLNPEISGIEE